MTKIQDIMSPKFQFVTPEKTLQDVAQMMRDLDFGFMPVGENDRLIGMVTDRDIAVRAVAEGKGPSTAVREVMTEKTYYCYNDQDVDEVCDNMAEIKVRRLPVVDRNKRLVGIVSLGDVSQATHRAKSGDALQEITKEVAAHKAAA
jgi:CBS domain-containing protein